MKKPSLQTILTPAIIDLYDLENTIVVVIDIFRATTTIVYALYNGCKKVIPVNDIEKCKQLGHDLQALTAGERNGAVIPGLQYGNSPLQYTKELVEGRTLVITTTNGTKLIELAENKNAHQIVIGSFLNFTVTCDYLIKQNKNVLLACAGWKGLINIEDSSFAGAVYEKVQDYFDCTCDATFMAHQTYLSYQTKLLELFKKANHWNRLISEDIKSEKDMIFATTIDVAPILSLYDQNTESIISS
ncbi:MAG: 2-phosphosulfolactate phosphatase [Phycisphaerales bacterium]|nr:2-phosphosulfolactate phosphatase [Phycisphaerales bacterium]